MSRNFTARIYGLVQGVGYRYFALRQAKDLGLVGFVRNLPEGSVQVLAQGPDSKLEAFLKLLRQGPSGARVSRMEVEWSEKGEGDLTDFTIEF